MNSEDFESLLDSSDSDANSHENSVFSAGATSITSKSSVMSVGPSSTILDQLVALLLEHEQFAPLCRLAIEREWIGPQRSERLFRDLLKNYSAELKKQVDGLTGQRRAAASFFLIRSRVAASKIRQCLDKSLKGHLDVPEDRVDKRDQVLDYLYRLQNSNDVEYIREDSESGDSSDNDVLPGDEPPDRLPQVDGIRDFLTKGPAFQALCECLEKVVNPSWEDRVEKFFDGIAKRTMAKRIPDTDLQQLRLLVADLLLIDQYSVSFLNGYEQSWLERRKSWLEQKTRTRWDWWPLEPPQIPLQSNGCIVRFSCVSVRHPSPGCCDFRF